MISFMTTKVHSNIFSLNRLLLFIIIIVIKSTEISKVSKVTKTLRYLVTELNVLSKPLIIIFIIVLTLELIKIYWITSRTLASKGFKFLSTLRFYTTATLSKKCTKIYCSHTTVLSMRTTANTTRFKSAIENVVAMST